MNIDCSTCKNIKVCSPFLSVDHDGPRLVRIIFDNNADNVAVHPLDINGVGRLAGPVNVATVGVQAEVMKLVVHLLSSAAHNC